MSGPRWWPTTSLSSFACDQAEASAAPSRSGKLAIASPSSCPRLRRQALSGADCTFDQAKFRKYIHNPDTNIAPNPQTEGKTARLWTETSLTSEGAEGCKCHPWITFKGLARWCRL